MCLDQSYYLACAQAAAGTLLAIQCRYASGKGQCVDVSIYEVAVVPTTVNPFDGNGKRQKLLAWETSSPEAVQLSGNCGPAKTDMSHGSS